MKKLILTEDFKQTQKVPMKKNGEPEEITQFALQTMQIINSGQIPYRDTKHYQAVRPGVKAILAQKGESIIVLEDAHYRVLWGTEDQPGFIRQFGGWLSFESTDEYIDIWENAENASIQVVKSLGKSK